MEIENVTTAQIIEYAIINDFYGAEFQFVCFADGLLTYNFKEGNTAFELSILTSHELFVIEKFNEIMERDNFALLILRTFQGEEEEVVSQMMLKSKK